MGHVTEARPVILARRFDSSVPGVSVGGEKKNKKKTSSHRASQASEEARGFECAVSAS